MKRVRELTLLLCLFVSLSFSASLAAPPPAADNSPRGVARAFAAAIDNGDAVMAEKFALTDADNKKLIEAMASVSRATKRFSETAIAKFGEEARKQINTMKTDLENLADATQKQEDANTVAFTNGHGKAIARVRLVNGVWKVDAVSTADGPAKVMIDFNTDLASRINKITDDVGDGKIQSSTEAVSDVAAVLIEEIMKTKAAGGGQPQVAHVDSSPAASAPAATAPGASANAPERSSGPISLKESNFGPPEGPATITMGKTVKLTATPAISDFFVSKAVVANASIKNTGGKPMNCIFNVAYFDKDSNLIACVSQSSDALKPGEETQLSSCMVVIPAQELKKIAKFQATFYESDKKF